MINGGRFKKGHIPWNTGMEGIHLNPEFEFKKGNIPWIKGRTMGSLSEEHKAKLSNALKGRVFTEEHKKKISEANKGQIPWCKGKHFSEEHKRKLSENNAHYWLGKHSSEETRSKISLAGKGRKHSVEHIKKILHRRTPTSLEDKFQKIIDKNNLPYKYVGDGKFFIEKYNPDFINTNHKKIAIEVYARYYKLRNNKTIEEWKEDRQKVFNKYGWKIIYFNEVEVNEKNVLEKIK